MREVLATSRDHLNYLVKCINKITQIYAKEQNEKRDDDTRCTYYQLDPLITCKWEECGLDQSNRVESS
jgi:hypothetical protein